MLHLSQEITCYAPATNRHRLKACAMTNVKCNAELNKAALKDFGAASSSDGECRTVSGHPKMRRTEVCPTNGLPFATRFATMES